MGGRSSASGVGPARSNYSSFLPDVYVGSPNRVERYGQYNTMDMDSEVNAALDILAEFCTQQSEENGTNFTFNFHKNATNSEVQILGQYLKHVCFEFFVMYLKWVMHFLCVTQKQKNYIM